ncbi:MAG: acyl carrier protein [Alphaproteobacteria bacterium]|nr:acyl carrier protein [Alphaproteobacteria bacterium]
MTDAHDRVLDRLLQLARDRYGARAEQLHAGDDLYAALQIDSMEAMDLLTALEETFDVEIPDYELQEVRTLSSIAEIVRQRLP